MALRFRRSIKLAPGLRLNLSKSGLGLSAGIRGLRVGLDPRGRTYTSAGIPGTGLSMRQYGGKSNAAGYLALGVAIGCGIVAVLVIAAAVFGH